DCSGTDTVSYRDFAEGYLLDKPLMDRFIAEYLPHTDSRTDPRVSPLLDPPREKLPAAVILTAGLDPLRDEGRMLAGQIAATGTEVHFIEAEGLLHGMATMRKVLPSGEIILRRAIGLFADLIRSQNNKT